MAFGKIKKAAPTETKAEEPVVEKEETSTALATEKDLSANLFDGLEIDTATAVDVIDRSIARGGSSSPFPVMRMDSAGAFDEPYNPREGVDYPAGKKGFVGIVLNWRFHSSVWAETYKENADKDKPIYSAAAPGGDPALAKLVVEAAAALQFTKSCDRAEKFDQSCDGPGAPTVAIELLVWCAEVGHIIIIETPAKYDSVVDTRDQLLKLVDEDTRRVRIWPTTIRPRMETRKRGGYNPKCFWVEFENYAGSDITAIGASFADYMSDLTDSEKDEINRWVRAEDRPLSDEHIECLRAARKINPPR